jgi:hypothetical protein
MLVVTGTFENERSIPDRPVSIPQKKKKAQIEDWSKTPEVQALVGALKDVGLPADISICDIRNERLAEKYKT